jgi:uncharacterized protein (DUF1778 family)
MNENKKVFRLVRWNTLDYNVICEAATKENRNVCEYIRIAALNAAKKTNENEK